ncbi:unnamed protein product [Aphanomyces euteiches]|uniref:Tudor domain-containing protein n=1 Tax=Aphanomyces euteiches TaxID=100861 RepID=A0A6G0WE77_9STRA|nr:hypothetical protein Ae201684_016709 [Aphanomyces euteiches]KAH9083162.1 hypothetical protein Ae201684P_014059 [Aphanomyces euteiches]
MASQPFRWEFRICLKPKTDGIHRSMYSVGARVDGLYAGGDVWFPGLIDGANADGSYAIQYDDGEREEAVQEASVRPHVAGTFSVGSRVLSRYNGGDDWYPGVISDINCDAETYDIAYDDGEFEPGVAFAMVEDESTAAKPASTADNHDDEEEEEDSETPIVHDDPPVFPQDGAPAVDCESAAEDATQAIDPGEQTLDIELTDTTQDANTRATDSTALVAQDDGQSEERPAPLSQDNASSSSFQQDPNLPGDAASPREPDEDAPEDSMSGRTSGRSTHDANVDTSLEIDVVSGENTIPTPLPMPTTSLPPSNNMFMFISSAPTIDKPSSLVDERQSSRDSTPRSVASDEILSNVLHHESETRGILNTIGAPVTDNDSMLVVKNALASFLQQLRLAPQLTVDCCRECRGESILLDCIRDNATYSILVCFAFVIIRRICAVSDAAFTTFIELHVIECVARIMGQFPHDAVLQASACGVLATLARSTGIQVMIELQVALLVIDVLKEHQALNHYSRQVHFYACEVLAKLCDGGDVRVIRLMTAKDPACHSPVHLFVLLLRQGHQHEDQKVACAACTLVLCLAARDRECANVLRSMGALADVSTIMAKYPNDNGIAAYSQSATREIALSSMKNGTTTKVQETAKGILKKEDLRLGGELFDPKPPKPKARKNKPSLAMDTPTKTTTTLFSRNTMSAAPQLSHNVADSITKIQQRTQKKASIDNASSMPPSSVKKRTAAALAWEQPTETKHAFVPFEQKLEMRMLQASNRKASVVTSPSKSHDREIVLLKTYGVPKIRNIDRVRGLPTASSTTRQKPTIPKPKPPATSFTARPPHTKDDAEKAGNPRERPLVKTPKPPPLDDKRMKTPEPKTTMTIKVVKQKFAQTPPSPSRDVQPSDMSQLATKLFQPSPAPTLTETRLSESRLSFSDKLHEMIKRAEVALCRPASSQRLDFQDMETTTVKFDEAELPKRPPLETAAIEKLAHAKPPPKPPKPTNPPTKETKPPLKPAPSARGGRANDHVVGKPKKDPQSVGKPSSLTMKTNAFQRPPSPKTKPTSPKTPTKSRAEQHKAESIPQRDAKPVDEKPPPATAPTKPQADSPTVSAPTPRQAECAQESAASEEERVEMPPIEPQEEIKMAGDNVASDEVSVSNVSEPSGVVDAMMNVSALPEVHVDPSSKSEAPRDEIKEETSEAAMEVSPTTDEEPLDEQMNEPNSARTAASYEDDEFESLEDDAEVKQPLDQSDDAFDTIEQLQQGQVVSDGLADEALAATTAMDAAPSDSKEDLDQSRVHGESSESTLDAVSHHDKEAQDASSSEIHVASPELCLPSLHTAGSNDADHGIDGEEMFAGKSEMEHDLLASSIATRSEKAADPGKDAIAEHEESSDGHEKDEAYQVHEDPALESNATQDTTTADLELSAIQTHAVGSPRDLIAHDEPRSLATELTEEEAQAAAAAQVTHQAVEDAIAPSISPQEEMKHEEIAPSDAQTAEPSLPIEGRLDDGCLESIARQEDVDEMLHQREAQILVDQVDGRDEESAQPDTSPTEALATDAEPIDEQIDDVQTQTSSAQSQESQVSQEQSQSRADEWPQVDRGESSPTVQTTLLDMRDDEFQPELEQDELMCLPPTEELQLGQETLALDANAADEGSSDEYNSTLAAAMDQSTLPATDRSIDTGDEAPWDAVTSEEESNVTCEIKQVSEETTGKTLEEDQRSPLTSNLVSLEAKRRDKRDDDGDPSSRQELKDDQVPNESEEMDKVDGKHSLSLATEDLPQTHVDDGLKTPPCVESNESHGNEEPADVCNLQAYSEWNDDSPNNFLSHDSSLSDETKEEKIASSAARLEDSAVAPPSDSTRMDECGEPSKDLTEAHVMDTTSENVSAICEAVSDTTAPSGSDDAMDGLDAENTPPSPSLDVDKFDEDEDPYGDGDFETLKMKAELAAHADDADISSSALCDFSESTTFAESRAMEASVESPGNSRAWTAVNTQQEANDTNDSTPNAHSARDTSSEAESTSSNESDAGPPEIAHGHPNVDGESTSSDETIAEPSATEVVETAEPEVAVEAPVVEPSEVVAEAVVESAAAEPTEDAIAAEAPVEAAVEPVVDAVVEAEPVVEPVVNAVTAPSEPVVESVVKPIVDAAVDAVEAHAHGPIDTSDESNRGEDIDPLEPVSVENEESAIQESHAVHPREEAMQSVVEKAGQDERHEQIAAPLSDQQVGAQDVDAGLVPTGDLMSVHADETLSMPSKSARSENYVENDVEKSPGASMPSNEESTELRVTQLALDRLEQVGDEDPYDGDDFESEREPPTDQAMDELVECQATTTTTSEDNEDATGDELNEPKEELTEKVQEDDGKELENGNALEDQVAGDCSCLEETPPMDSTEHDAKSAAKEDFAAKSANIGGDTALGNESSHEASTPAQSAEAFMTTTEDLSIPREEPKLHEETSPNPQIGLTNEDVEAPVVTGDSVQDEQPEETSAIDGGNAQETTTGNGMEEAEDALRPQSSHERRKSTDDSELMELKATPRSSISSSSASSSTLSSSSSTSTSLSTSASSTSASSTSASSNPSQASEHKSKNDGDSYDQADFDQLDNMQAANEGDPLPTNDVESTSRVDLESFDDHAAVPTVEKESNGSIDDDAQVAAPSSRETLNRPSEDVMVPTNEGSTSISTAVDAPSVPTIDLRGLNAMQDDDPSEPSRCDEPTKPEDALVHGIPDAGSAHDDGQDASFGQESPPTSRQVSPVLKDEQVVDASSLTPPHGDESTAWPSTDEMSSPVVVETETALPDKTEHPVDHAMETQQRELDVEASESSSSTSAMNTARSTSSTEVEIDPVLRKDASTKSADSYEEDEFESASDAPSTSRKDDGMSPREPFLDVHPRHESEPSDDSAPSDKLDAALLSTLDDDTPKEESKQATEAPAAVEALARPDRAEEGKEAPPPPFDEEEDPQLGEDIYADDDFED